MLRSARQYTRECGFIKGEKMKLQNFHFRLVLTPEVMAECVEVIDNKNATGGQV